MSIKPVAWHTEDHTDDCSATTYDESVAIRWDMKGWPVTPMYYAIPDTHRVVPVELLESAVIAAYLSCPEISLELKAIIDKEPPCPSA